MWRGILTGKSFSDPYDARKASVNNKNSLQVTQPESAKVFYAVISAQQNKKSEQCISKKEKQQKIPKRQMFYLQSQRAHDEVVLVL